MKALYVIGRAVFGGFFLYNGINHFLNQEPLSRYANAKELPMPDEAVLASGALMTVAGISLVFGLKPRWGAAGVLTFLAAASPLFHDFWNMEDPQQAQNDMIHFSKNMALAGAAIALAGAGGRSE